MIGDGRKYHYLAVTSSSELLEGNSSNHTGHFYCLNCFNSYTTKNKLKEHEEICNKHNSCRMDMPEQVNKTLKYNPGETSLKELLSVCLGLECTQKKYNLVKTTLSDVFENFRNMCLKIYELYPVYFISAPRLSWQACLKKVGVELELLTDCDILLMIEKGIRGGTCQPTYRYAKANNKYMKNYIKSIESSFIKYLDANNVYGWAMSQKLPINGFKWIKKKNYQILIKTL